MRFLPTISIVVTVGFSSLFPEQASFAQKEMATLLVPVGFGVWKIGRRCETLGIIRDAGKFAFLAKVTGLDRKLKAGKYRLKKGQSELMVLEILARGDTAKERVVIPEGSTAEEIANRLKKMAGIEKRYFLYLVRNPNLSGELGVEADNLEGYLYPDSYEFNWGMKPEKVIRIMVNRFFQVFGDKERWRLSQLGLTINQIVTLASMIEKEARLDEERPVIAAVYYNRLKRGLRLQCDATVLYALPEHKERLLYSDLKVDSPYNTYRHKGLPPGPICNPGRASIEAALYPTATDYLYYVAKGDGSHIFSKTPREHITAKRKARKYRERF